MANLFGVELWERFSSYGMLTILGYYLYYSVTEGGLGLPKARYYSPQHEFAYFGIIAVMAIAVGVLSSLSHRG
ncbi:MAG: major facilitator transporter [Mycobacterium sp.]|nr:major facilitator transporter [Mycobacterium sp.]